ncbi:pyridoxamine kinase [Megamonas hypermegale]|uniref:pyridoxamine kinase n=1 Tax=Megamonas hypermegale TaxID=158847 RepID=UPI0026EE6C75|nr:pyridoxamine kinase [Megamonas hypermegale]
MNRQKRIALINDITGFGRCSVTVQLPLISALKVQACPLPTAILSAHTGFPVYYMDDYTRHMQEYMDNWQQLKLEFDGIVSGFLGSKEQIGLVLEFAQRFKREDTLFVVDPVMGDGGRLYSSYDDALCREMRRLIPAADVITPNLTEVCQLLDLTYPEKMPSLAELDKMAGALNAQGPKQIVITGLVDGDTVYNYIYQQGKNSYLQANERVLEEHSGTGDAFVAIVAACLVKGEELTTAVHKAADFVGKAMRYTNSLQVPWNYGLCFEEYLTELK